MDVEYIRYLMLYSDQKYPFEKAKSDPGLTESVRSVKKYMKDKGVTRKMSHEEAQQILLNERNASREVRDIDDEYTPKAEKFLKSLENSEPVQHQSQPQTDLEKEVAMLKKMLHDKEAELKARSNVQPSGQQNIWPKSNEGKSETTEFGHKHVRPDGIIERKLKDTGYTDKINDKNE
jgi:hypothetical protein